MKSSFKYKIYGGIFFVLIIFLFLGIIVYAIGRGNGDFKITEIMDKFFYNDLKQAEEEEKIIEEIKYIQSGIIDISNCMNGLDLNQIFIKTEIIKEDESEKENKGENTKKDEVLENNNIKMEIESNNINENNNIKWEEVEGKIQTISQSLPVVIIDLKTKGIDNNIILNISELNNQLMQFIYLKNKSEILKNCYLINDEFVKIYEKLGKGPLVKKEKLISNFLKIHYTIEINDINELKNASNLACINISELLTKVEIDDFNKISVKKVYVMVNDFNNIINKINDLDNKKFYLSKYIEILSEILNF